LNRSLVYEQHYAKGCGDNRPAWIVKTASDTLGDVTLMRFYAEHRQSPLVPPASSLVDPSLRAAKQGAIQRAAAILKKADHHSRDELDAALADARRAILLSLEEAGVDAGAGQALILALDVAGAISQNRA
jgi:hypothetical protein